MGVGLARMGMGAVQGLDANEARADRESDRQYTQLKRERESTQFDQGQADRDYILARRDIEAARADEQYKINKDFQDRQLAFTDGLRSFMSTNDLTGLNKAFKKYAPEGADIDLKPDPDGSYSVTTTYQGKSETKKVTPDEIGTAAHLFITKNVGQILSDQIKAKASAKEKSNERKHDMAKLEKEYSLKRGLEDVKGKNKIALEREKNGVGGKSGKVPDWEKQIEKSSAKLYGGTFSNGMWSFDDKVKEEKYLIHRDISRAYYLAGEGSVTVSDRQARHAMTVIEAEAKKVVDRELDEGLDPKNAEKRLIEVMNSFTDQRIKSLAPKPGDMTAGTGQGLGRDQAGAKTGASGQPPTWEVFLERAKQKGRERGLSDAEIESSARKYYDGKYGSKGTPGNKTEKKIDLSRVMMKGQNPRKAFDRQHRNIVNGLKKGDSDYANHVIKMLDSKFLAKLTPKQRKKAEKLIEDAKKLTNKAE